MAYDVRFPNASIEKQFGKALSKIPKDTQGKIIESIESLKVNPRPFSFKKIKPPVELFSFVAQYRIRVGSYRILYDVDDEKKIVWVFALRKRDERTYK